jgi:hypothetical protein
MAACPTHPPSSSLEDGPLLPPGGRGHSGEGGGVGHEQEGAVDCAGEGAGAGC